jgi:hypothetical protein
MDRMTRRPTRLALLALLCLAGTTRADFLPSWTISATPNTPVLHSSKGGAGMVFLAPTITLGEGDSNIILATLTTASSAGRSTPDVFTSVPWSVTLHILDEATGKTGSMTITGLLSGTLSGRSGSFTTTYTSPLTQGVQLGETLYTVTVGPPLAGFTSPGGPLSSAPGAIGAYVDPPKSLPEPSSLVLTGLGAVGCWVVARRRRAAAPA